LGQGRRIYSLQIAFEFLRKDWLVAKQDEEIIFSPQSREDHPVFAELFLKKEETPLHFNWFVIKKIINALPK